MDAFVPFGSAPYFSFLGLVLLARGADFLSTWTATPRLLLEANPIARALGWRWGALVNAVAAGLVAMWPLPAVIVATASVLVAARNFQSAWLARSMGEDEYRSWLGERLSHARRGLFVFCVFAQSALVAAVGAAVIWLSRGEPISVGFERNGAERSILFGVGVGIVTYAAAVLLFTMLSARRLWRGTADSA